MSHYTDLLKRTISAFSVTVPTDRLAYVLCGHYHKIPFASHEALVRDTLSGVKIDSIHRYTEYLRRIEPMEHADGETSDTWLARQLAYRQKLINDIKKNGVKEPVDIFMSNGGIVYFHGYHRFTAALLLGHPNMETKIHVLDQELSEAGRRLFSIYPTRPHSVYQPLSHPLFRLLDVHNIDLPVKVSAILNTHTPATFLDVGCNLGYVSRRLLAAAWTGVGIDFDGKLGKLQPFLEACGEAPMDYQVGRLEHFVQDHPDFKCVAIFLSFLHHYFSLEERYKMLQEKVFPWMRSNCAVAYVEHEFGGKYSGLVGSGQVERHVTFEDREAVYKYWPTVGYEAKFLYRASTYNRELFRLTRKENREQA